ncbi:hypothetical protein CJ195_19350 [Bacillus sp. UMB0899]|uniref:hypothetical protein n=1 Tax=Metabacillus schmidteae TaxID=2730405 RepID=UPI000C80DA55|nr:hypothetical protein [Metabacillus schmidteae]PMC35235.1 hypothetical protein CJ195_19350 [Bacillus sp. UMB0899]
MDKQMINDILNQLRDGELHEYYVTKEHFLPFREVLVAREDFKHFRGIAQQGGHVVYRYLNEPRS